MYEWDGTEYVNISGPVASDQNVYFEKVVGIDSTVPADTYTSTFTASTAVDTSGEKHTRSLLILFPRRLFV